MIDLSKPVRLKERPDLSATVLEHDHEWAKVRTSYLQPMPVLRVRLSELENIPGSPELPCPVCDGTGKIREGERIAEPVEVILALLNGWDIFKAIFPEPKEDGK